jgi:hypothetical protein
MLTVSDLDCHPARKANQLIGARVTLAEIP